MGFVFTRSNRVVALGRSIGIFRTARHDGVERSPGNLSAHVQQPRSRRTHTFIYYRVKRVEGRV